MSIKLKFNVHYENNQKQQEMQYTFIDELI